MTLPDFQATNMNSGRITSSTGATGGAMTMMRIRNMRTKGRSVISTAEPPDSVLRTVSTSRNRPCQWPAGLDSSSDRGSDINLSNNWRPTSTSTRSATVCMTRDRASFNTKSKMITAIMPMTSPHRVEMPLWNTTRSKTCMENTGVAKATRLMKADISTTSRKVGMSDLTKGFSHAVLLGSAMEFPLLLISQRQTNV